MKLAAEAPLWLALILALLLVAAAVEDAARLRISNITCLLILCAAFVAIAVSGPESALGQNIVVFGVLLAAGLLSFLREFRASRRASRSAFAASRFLACKSAIASTRASFFILVAPSTPNWVATVFNFGRVIAASSGLCERTGSCVVVICFFSLLDLRACTSIP